MSALLKHFAMKSARATAPRLLSPPKPTARNFLPGLGKILANSGDGSLRRKQSWQRIVPHRTATIFNAVADVEDYASFLPWCLSSQVLERSTADDASGECVLLTEITVGYQTLKSTLKSRVEISPMRVHSTSDANEYLDHLSFTWDFRDVDEQTCRLDMTLGTHIAHIAHTCTSCLRVPALTCVRGEPFASADFSLRNPEQVLMWDFAHDKIISEYVRQFSRRCAAVEARAST